jgi:hypothetical protein
MATFSPANLELYEFLGTTGQTVQIVPTAPIPPALDDVLTITSVTVNAFYEDLTITWANDSFTFKSKFDDTFSRSIKYLIQSESGTKSFGVATKFIEVPSVITGVYQYIPPSVTYKNIIFTIVADGAISGTNTYTWTLTVRYDFEYSNNAFKNLITSGEDYKKALLEYPELA